jgi:hypothetical protein
LHPPLSPSLHALHTEGALPNRSRWAEVRSSILSEVEQEVVGAFSVNLPVAVPPHEALAYVLTILPPGGNCSWNNANNRSSSFRDAREGELHDRILRMSEQLAEMKCTACRGDEPTLSDEEIEELMQQVPE